MKMHRIVMAAAVATLMGFAATTHAEPSGATGSVSGTIKGPDGKPAAGVVVRLTTAGAAKVTNTAAEAKPKKDKKAAGPSGTTDAKGEFKIADVPAGPYVLIANAKDVGRAKTNVTVSANQDFPVNLTLTAPKKKKA